MPVTGLQCPVGLVVFNRPETTERVWAQIETARPARLLVIADGPRRDRPGEGDRCAAARAITERIGWHCEVLRNYSDANLGCRRRVSSGLDWAFRQVEQAIILEDDCVPHPDFFPFCEELLERFQDDGRVMAICGNNHLPPRPGVNASYRFSRYVHVWGWATWRRAWKHYDVDMQRWPSARDTEWFKVLFGNRAVRRYWTRTLQATYEGRINTWDYQWTFACWLQNGLAVVPNVNLVANIGFGAEATHTSGQGSVAYLRTHALSFPLQHPGTVLPDLAADNYTQRFAYFDPDLLVRARAIAGTVLARLKRT